MLDQKQSLLLLFNLWVKCGNSKSTRQVAFLLDYRAGHFFTHPTLISLVKEDKRACLQSREMQTSL